MNNSYLAPITHTKQRKAPTPENKWEVVYDPSGVFINRYFRATDLLPSNPRTGKVDCWPDEITFKHITTNEVRTVQRGFMNKYCSDGWGLYRIWIKQSETIQSSGGNPDASASVKQAEQDFRQHLKTCKACKAYIVALFAYVAQMEVLPHETSHGN